MKFEGNFFDPEAVKADDLPTTKAFSPESEKSDPLEQKKVVSERLARLWRQFNFKGHPPKAGSPVEKRLFDVCDKYINIVINPELSKLSSSDPARRELHNQIALMVAGEQRSKMKPQEAELIADFACQFSKGFSLSEANF